jgi:cytochrome b
MPTTVRVWDLPTRVFHWALVACVIGLVATGYAGKLEWHARFGYAMLTLLAFRIVWGLFGGYWSRFTSFLYGPGSVFAYVSGRGHPDHTVGHNPLGAGSVFAMLLVLAAQVGTGLVSDDESSFTGPFNRYVSNATGLAAMWYHKRVGQWLLIGLVVLHVAAIVYYRVRKQEDLVRPMLVGDKIVEHPARSSRDDALTRTAGLVLLAICGGAVAWLVIRLGG